jgi:hypothetical protein
MEVTKKGKWPSWIGQNSLKGLRKIWDAPSYKVKTARAKDNRASPKGGSAIQVDPYPSMSKSYGWYNVHVIHLIA